METVSELKEYVATLPDAPTDYRIAVGSLIFTKADKVILIERGGVVRDSAGYLEGVGGGVDDGEENLHEVLRREIREEIGDVEVSIDDVLTIKFMPGEDYPWWVIVDYLCRLTRGTPRNMEPHKCNAVLELSLAEIPQEKLSTYQRPAMKAYAEKFGNKPYYKQ
jgi:ADP-ribose pyrophosphatase YjhB (NUDIX family)